MTDTKNLRNQIKSVLIGISTFKKLFEIWPEIEEYAKEYIEIKNYPIAFPIESINKNLGIDKK